MHPNASLEDPILSVVIPAWNEERVIQETLEELDRCLSNLAIEIIVVDDGSQDNTSEIATAWRDCHSHTPLILVKNTRNSGKGYSVKQGVAHSRGDFVAFIDADLDIPPREILSLLLKAKEDRSGVVVGVKRQIMWKTRGIPLYRKFISIVFSYVVSLLFRLPISDTQTGIKMFDGNWLRHAVREVSVDRFLFDLELLIQAHSEGLSIVEKVITLTPSSKKNRITFHHILQSIGELCAIFIRYRIFSRYQHHNSTWMESDS